MDEAEMMALVSGLASLLAVLVSLGALYYSKQATWVGARQAMLEAFDRLNAFALADEENLLLLNRVFDPDHAEEDLERTRVRWVCYSILNALELALVAKREGTIEPETADRFVAYRLGNLLNHPVARGILRQGAYSTALTAEAERLLAARAEETG